MGHKHWGGKNFWKIYFQKKSLKVPFNSQKNSDDLFFSRQLFSKNVKCTLLIENVQIYFLFFVFIFLSLCFCFLSCLFFYKYKKLKNSRLIIGGQKRGFAQLNFWGRVPGMPPRVYAYGHMKEIKCQKKRKCRSL